MCVTGSRSSSARMAEFRFFALSSASDSSAYVGCFDDDRGDGEGDNFDVIDDLLFLGG